MTTTRASGATQVDSVLLKLSGEALAGDLDFGIDPAVVLDIAREIRPLVDGGTRLAIVLGGGNLFRGAELAQHGMDRVTGDQMGMLATVMNGLAVRDVLGSQGIDARVLSALAIPGLAARYSVADATAALDDGEVVLLVAGTGNPFFTTDTAACLRAIELGMDAVLKATQVDGVYSADPKLDPTASRYDAVSFDEVIKLDLKVMDLAAFTLCRDHAMPIHVFDVATPGALKEIVGGGKVGTRIG